MSTSADTTSGPPSRATLRRAVARDPLHWVAFGFGLGLLPVGPGTWGSLLGIPLYLLLLPLGFEAYMGCVIAAFLAGIWLCGESARRLGAHDHPGIVWDEVVGMLFTLAAVPPEWPWILAGFLAFRAADIWKPWPIRDLDHRLSGGLGIMLDDVVAAAYAVIFLVFLQVLV